MAAFHIGFGLRTRNLADGSVGDAFGRSMKEREREQDGRRATGNRPAHIDAQVVNLETRQLSEYRAVYSQINAASER